ncbi:hypothetical protein [Planococcus dechangensis]|uniref:Uncharacterized protein n=1 Tax=Planococcus dechangensis TaxID=1176255 RepID=A0ABV9M8Z4_9BACL
MKSTRWRAIIKSAARKVPHKMNRYYWAEETEIVHGVRVISLEEEMNILETLHSYANSIKRTSKIEMHEHPKEWVQELTNFTD